MSFKAGGIKAGSNRRDSRFNSSMSLFGGEFSAPRTATVQTQPENTDFTYLVKKSFSDVLSAALCLSDSSYPSQKQRSAFSLQMRSLAENFRRARKPLKECARFQSPTHGVVVGGGTGSLLKVSVQSTLTSKEKIKRL